MYRLVLERGGEGKTGEPRDPAVGFASNRQSRENHMLEPQSGDWLDIGAVRASTILPSHEIMRKGAFEGGNRKWFTDGTHIWFRRKEANPETITRHNRFMREGDYEYLGTDDDVEVYRLRDQSRFRVAGANTKIVDLDALWGLGQWQVERLAAMSAVKRNWENFVDICGFIRERVRAKHGANVAQGDLEYADFTQRLAASITQRLGPSWGEVEREVGAIHAKRNKGAKGRVITLG